jgi:hypothetical protein
MKDWENRATPKKYGMLTVTVPSVEDLMIPKRKRGEPREESEKQGAAADFTFLENGGDDFHGSGL